MRRLLCLLALLLFAPILLSLPAPRPVAAAVSQDGLATPPVPGAVPGPAPAPAPGGSAFAQNATAEPQKGGVTGLPLPRFVSLRADEVNLRTGPGIRYPIDWVYLRSRLPVEVIDEFESWRRIRDRQGTSGWVHQSMLAADRTGVVTGERRALLAEPALQSPIMAWLEPGVIVTLESCEGAWCLASVLDGEQRRHRGWILKEQFWGAYADESFR